MSDSFDSLFSELSGGRPEDMLIDILVRNLGPDYLKRMETAEVRKTPDHIFCENDAKGEAFKNQGLQLVVIAQDQEITKLEEELKRQLLIKKDLQKAYHEVVQEGQSLRREIETTGNALRVETAGKQKALTALRVLQDKISHIDCALTNLSASRPSKDDLVSCFNEIKDVLTAPAE